MINSRSLDDLLPQVKERVEKFIANCKSHNIDLLVTSTYRDFESQAALYAQGRTTPGNIVTNIGKCQTDDRNYLTALQKEKEALCVKN